MNKCVVRMIIDGGLTKGGKETVIKECNNYVEANQYKLFREETDNRDNVEYVIK